MSRNSGDRRDRQKSEQPVERGLLARVDGGKNVVNRGHLRLLSLVAVIGSFILPQRPEFVVPTSVLSIIARPKTIER
jgi:hypothetical protein